MLVQPGDLRPPSALMRTPFDLRMAMGGAATALGAHVVLPVLVTLVMAAGGLGLASQAPKPTFAPEQIVSARFVKLGKKLDPNQLPNRQVIHKTTAPDDRIAVSKELEPEPPKEKPEKAPPDAEDDDLKRLGDQAHKFSELADQLDEEGDPNGIKEGTETEATAGNLYWGQVMSFFKKGWQVPTTFSSEQLKKLVVVLSIQVKDDLSVGRASVSKSSGDLVFDQSALDQIQRLSDQGLTVPEPPLEEAAKVKGQVIGANFYGRNAN